MSFNLVSPIDDNVIATIQYTRNVDEILQRGKIVQKEWCCLPVEQRVEMLRKCVNLIVDSKERLALELTRCIGRPTSYTPGEIDGFAYRANFLLDMATEQLKETVIENDKNHLLKIIKEPVGTVLIIGAWNYPYLVIVNTLIPALAAGNAVVLKHASATALIGDSIRDIFLSAGLPSGLLESIHLSNEDTEALVVHPDINFVSLVGSVGAGRSVLKRSTVRQSNFIKVSLELGGCDAAYVRHDANIKTSAEQLAEGAFFNSGQSCCGVQRIFVAESIFDEFVASFSEEMKAYTLGNSYKKETKLGPVVSADAGKIIGKDLSDDQGSERVIRLPIPQEYASNPAYIAPVAFIEPNPESKIMNHEIFGPNVGICRVANDEEAIKRINCNSYGLTTSIWTVDAEFVECNKNRFNSGSVYMNKCDWLRINSNFVLTFLDPGLPWSGRNLSGYGFSLSKFSYESVTNFKSIAIFYQ